MVVQTRLVDPQLQENEQGREQTGVTESSSEDGEQEKQEDGGQRMQEGDELGEEGRKQEERGDGVKRRGRKEDGRETREEGELAGGESVLALPLAAARAGDGKKLAALRQLRAENEEENLRLQVRGREGEGGEG
eukprot:534518-Hanusia_phi.AAC.1